MTARFNVDLGRQVAYAAKQAVNETAKKVRDQGEGTLKHDLTIRTDWHKPGRRFGFNVKFATGKTTNPTASIYSRAEWLSEVEGGGAKRNSKGGRLAIPTAFWKARQDIMLRRKKPKAILRKGKQESAAAAMIAIARLSTGSRDRGKALRAMANDPKLSRKAKRAQIAEATMMKRQHSVLGSLVQKPFILRKQSGRAVPGIYVRSTSRRLPIHKLFSFHPSARVGDKLDYREDTVERVRKIIGREYAEALRRAIGSAAKRFAV